MLTEGFGITFDILWPYISQAHIFAVCEGQAWVKARCITGLFVWKKPLFLTHCGITQVTCHLKQVMGLGQNFLTWFGSNFWCSGRVGSAIFGLGLDLKNFHYKSHFFNFCHWGQKYLGQSRVSLLLKVCLGQVPSQPKTLPLLIWFCLMNNMLLCSIYTLFN